MILLQYQLHPLAAVVHSTETRPVRQPQPANLFFHRPGWLVVLDTVEYEYSVPGTQTLMCNLCILLNEKNKIDIKHQENWKRAERKAVFDAGRSQGMVSRVVLVISDTQKLKSVVHCQCSRGESRDESRLTEWSVFVMSVW